MDVLGLITARGGSKGIPGKNLIDLGGIPLIGWTIKAAQKSKYLNSLIVSTDDLEIADIAKKHGAEVPFVRPRELAGDNAEHVPVVQHAVVYMENVGHKADYILLLQPTSPFRSSQDIDNAIELANQEKAECVLGVTETLSHPFFIHKINEDGFLEHVFESPSCYSRRQDLPKYYVENGAIYLVTRNLVVEEGKLKTDHCTPYIMPRDRSIDIDDGYDLMVARAYVREKLRSTS